MGKTDARSKKQSQPGKPKRSTSAYLFFMSHLRNQLKAQGKSMKVGDLAKEGSEKWHALDDIARKPFNQQALADKKRYESEMGIFKPAKDPNKPKRPSTGYFHFLAEFRVSMKGTDIGHKDVVKQAGQAWQRLTDVQKEPFLKKQRAEQIEYEKKMRVYKENLSAAPVPPPVVEDNGDMDDDEEEDEEEGEEEGEEDYSDEEA